MKVDIQLYGAFRQCDATGHIQLEVSDACTVEALRQALAKHLSQHCPGFHSGLLQHSAFADATQILSDTQQLPSHAQLAILPPVSGG